MKYLLTYYVKVGTKALRCKAGVSILKQWPMRMKSELLYTNNFSLGKFKITEI
jgi:hypothetical protein